MFAIDGGGALSFNRADPGAFLPHPHDSVETDDGGQTNHSERQQQPQPCAALTRLRTRIYRSARRPVAVAFTPQGPSVIAPRRCSTLSHPRLSNSLPSPSAQAVSDARRRSPNAEYDGRTQKAAMRWITRNIAILPIASAVSFLFCHA